MHDPPYSRGNIIKQTWLQKFQIRTEENRDRSIESKSW